MNYIELDPELLRAENTELKRTLKKSENLVHQLNNSLVTSKKIIEDLKEQNLRLKQENTALTQKVYDSIGEKNDLQLQIDTTIRNLQNQIEEKQRELEDEKQRISPALDQEFIRNRLANEIEMMHRYDIEAKDLEIERLQEKLQEAKREIELNKSRMEGLRLENDRDLRELKQKHKIAIDEILIEAKGLGGSRDNKKEREAEKQLRQELEKSREKLREKDERISKISRERDRAFEEKHDYVKSFTEDIEKERNWRRNLLSENERLLQRIRLLEEEIRLGARSPEASLMGKGSVREHFPSVYPNTEFPMTELNLGDEIDRDDFIVRLKNQYNELVNRYANLQSSKAALEANYQEEIKKLQKATQEDSNKSKGQTDNMKKDLEDKIKVIATLEEASKSLKEEHLQINLESSQLKRKLADFDYENSLLKQHNELLQKQISEIENKNRQPQVIGNSSKPNQAANQELPRADERVERYKKKMQALKAKLKQANSKIMSLLKEKMGGDVGNKENLIAAYMGQNAPGSGGSVTLEDNELIGRISQGLKKEIKEERANLEAMRKAVELGYAENTFNPFQGKALINTREDFMFSKGGMSKPGELILRPGAREDSFMQPRPEDYQAVSNEELREKAKNLAMMLKTSDF